MDKSILKTPGIAHLYLLVNFKYVVNEEDSKNLNWLDHNSENLFNHADETHLLFTSKEQLLAYKERNVSTWFTSGVWRKGTVRTADDKSYLLHSVFLDIDDPRRDPKSSVYDSNVGFDVAERFLKALLLETQSQQQDVKNKTVNVTVSKRGYHIEMLADETILANLGAHKFLSQEFIRKYHLEDIEPFISGHIDICRDETIKKYGEELRNNHPNFPNTDNAANLLYVPNSIFDFTDYKQESKDRSYIFKNEFNSIWYGDIRPQKNISADELEQVRNYYKTLSENLVRDSLSINAGKIFTDEEMKLKDNEFKTGVLNHQKHKQFFPIEKLDFETKGIDVTKLDENDKCSFTIPAKQNYETLLRAVADHISILYCDSFNQKSFIKKLSVVMLDFSFDNVVEILNSRYCLDTQSQTFFKHNCNSQDEMAISKILSPTFQSAHKFFYRWSVKEEKENKSQKVVNGFIIKYHQTKIEQYLADRSRSEFAKKYTHSDFLPYNPLLQNEKIDSKLRNKFKKPYQRFYKLAEISNNKLAEIGNRDLIQEFICNLRDVMLCNVCQGNEEKYKTLFCWFLWLIKKPNEKMTYLPIIQGDSGIGKSCSIDAWAMIINKNHYTSIGPSSFNDNLIKYNSNLADVLLANIDEIPHFSKTLSVWSILKKYTSSSKQDNENFQFTEKNKKSFQGRLCANFVITTNSELVFSPESTNERRQLYFQCAKVDPSLHDNDPSLVRIAKLSKTMKAINDSAEGERIKSYLYYHYTKGYEELMEGFDPTGSLLPKWAKDIVNNYLEKHVSSFESIVYVALSQLVEDLSANIVNLNDFVARRFYTFINDNKPGKTYDEVSKELAKAIKLEFTKQDRFKNLKFIQALKGYIEEQLNNIQLQRDPELQWCYDTHRNPNLDSSAKMFTRKFNAIFQGKGIFKYCETSKYLTIPTLEEIKEFLKKFDIETSAD